MKIIVAFGALLIVSSLQAEGKEIIKDKSPDGKFALRLTHGEEGWDTEIIETGTKKKVIDLESVAATGDKDRIVWMSDSSRSVDTYGDEATLVWSRDSQRVAYYDLDRRNRTMSVYFRNGSSFEEVSLPEFPKCDEIKNEDPKYLEIVHFGVKPIYWMDSGALSVSVEHWWRIPEGKLKTCEPTITMTFDAQRHASLAKAETPPEEIGQKIESPNGTFFLEELPAPTKNEAGETMNDQEVWIVSARDPAKRERLPGFHMAEGVGVISGAAISPDENWMLVARHHGSHMNSTHLFHRKEGLKFENVFPNANWPPDPESTDRFDNEAWKYFSKIEGVPLTKIDMKDLGPERISFLDWSADSGRLLIDLHGGLTGSVETPDRNLYKKPGVSAWVAYFNTKTKRFELTDRLRARNKGARKRWKAMDNDNEEAPEEGFVPPSAESIGHEGPDLPVAERLKKYEAELAAMVKRRAGQLDGADRAEFEKKEADWRDKLDDDAAQIKDPAKQLGMRARSTWYHLINVREERLPIYEEAKSGDAKQSQP
ncbi:MAG TPA: hypothetical protein VEQ38_09105 [Verrucomicrobiae bacterium]|nr:hypothetical protein [Verrucomicrobiae bacterium]